MKPVPQSSVGTDPLSHRRDRAAFERQCPGDVASCKVLRAVLESRRGRHNRSPQPVIQFLQRLLRQVPLTGTDPVSASARPVESPGQRSALSASSSDDWPAVADDGSFVFRIGTSGFETLRSSSGTGPTVREPSARSRPGVEDVLPTASALLIPQNAQRKRIGGCLHTYVFRSRRHRLAGPPA